MTTPSPARITRMSLLGGSMSRLSGTPSAVPRAQSVSRDGLPVPLSSWERVDLAMPARLASSVRDTPALARSRRSDMETTVTMLAGPSWGSDTLVRSIVRFVRFDEQLRLVHYSEHADYMANATARAAPGCWPRLPGGRDRRGVVRGDVGERRAGLVGAGRAVGARLRGRGADRGGR